MKYKISELESGQVYTREDDAIYYCVMVGCDWALILHYSMNHCVCNAEFWSQEDLDKDYNVHGLHKNEDGDYWKGVFEERLRFCDYDMLTDKEE